MGRRSAHRVLWTICGTNRFSWCLPFKWRCVQPPIIELLVGIAFHKAESADERFRRVPYPRPRCQKTALIEQLLEKSSHLVSLFEEPFAAAESAESDVHFAAVEDRKTHV